MSASVDFASAVVGYLNFFYYAEADFFLASDAKIPINARIERLITEFENYGFID